MSKNLGKILRCDRCGKEKFLRYIKQGDLDGGYTKYDVYEDYPETWLNETQMGDLCDECAFKFRSWVTEFMNGKVAWSWNVEKNKLQEVPDEK